MANDGKLAEITREFKRMNERVSHIWEMHDNGTLTNARAQNEQHKELVEFSRRLHRILSG